MAGKTRQAWSSRDRKALAEYVGELVGRLRLRDWEITLDFDHPAGGDAYAEITPHENQKRAEIRFGKEFRNLDPEGVRQTLTHELLHCHLFNVQHTAEAVFDVTMGSKAATIAALSLNAEIERATDALADAMSLQMPMPPRLAAAKPEGSVVLVALPTAVKSARKGKTERP